MSSIRGRGLSARYTNFYILLIAPGRRINVSLNGISLLPVRRGVSVPCAFRLVKIINPNGIPNTSRVNFLAPLVRELPGRFSSSVSLSRRAIPLVPSSRSTLSRVALRDVPTGVDGPPRRANRGEGTLSIGYRL